MDGIINSNNESIEETFPVSLINVQYPCPLCKEGGKFCNGTCKEECEECDMIRTQTEEDNIYHIINQHEPKEVLEFFGREYVTKHQHTISRDMGTFQDAMHSSKWGTIL